MKLVLSDFLLVYINLDILRFNNWQFKLRRDFFRNDRSLMILETPGLLENDLSFAANKFGNVYRYGMINRWLKSHVHGTIGYSVLNNQTYTNIHICILVHIHMCSFVFNYIYRIRYKIVLIYIDIVTYII
jgi:hypothetical protein